MNKRSKAASSSGRHSNPLRLFSLFAILGDIALILSGGYFFNPLRSSVAIFGIFIHMVGVAYGSHKKIRLLGRSIVASDFVMGIICLCGLAYSLSGSNVFGFEDAPRYTEIVLGIFISLGALCILNHRPNLASLLFSAGPILYISQAFETLFTQGKFDVSQIVAGLCFFSSGMIARKIKKKPGDVVNEASL